MSAKEHTEFWRYLNVDQLYESKNGPGDAGKNDYSNFFQSAGRFLTQVTPTATGSEFLHRDSLVDKILNDMDSGSVIWINGMGGIGKTAVARAICSHKASRDKKIAWVEYEGSLQNSFVNAFEFKREVDGDEAKFNIIKAYLESMADLILVIDNFDAIAPEDREAKEGEENALNWLSHLQCGVIITSRLDSIKNFKPYHVDFLSLEECTEIFYHYQQNSSRQETETVEKIVRLTGYHTLTVELLAKTAEALYGNDLARLYQDLTTVGFGFTDVEINTMHAKDRYEKTSEHIRKLYVLNGLEELQQRILKNFALLPDITIPREIAKWLKVSVNEIIKLCRLGWLAKAGDGYTMHAIVKESIRLNGEIGYDECFNLLDTFTQPDFVKKEEVYTKVKVLLNIADSLFGYFSSKVGGREVEEHFASFAHNMAGMFRGQGEYQKALKLYNKALCIRERVFGKGHPDPAATYNNVGDVYQIQGEYDRALKFYNKALVINEKVFGKEHLETTTIYNNMASIYRVWGEYERALGLYAKALVVCIKVNGEEYSFTAITYNNIAIIYRAQGKYEQALTICKKALTIHEKVLGKEHPDTASTYNNIADIYQAQKEYEKALIFYNKALVIQERVFGEGHLDTATTYNNMAGVFKSQGEYEKTLEFYERALAIQERVLGKEHHPSRAAAYNNIAGVYQSQKEYEKALKFYNKALIICKEIFDKEHPYTAITYNNLAGVYEGQGDFDKALEYVKTAFITLYFKLGPEHPTTITVSKNMRKTFNLANKDQSFDEFVDVLVEGESVEK